LRHVEVSIPRAPSPGPPNARRHSPVASLALATSPLPSPLASMVPASIPVVQAPATQVVPDGHANAAPHPPQLFLLVMVLTQALPQSVG
jgi:hypothetical protein